MTMTKPTAPTAWEGFCGKMTDAIREAAHDRMYGAAPPRDLIDFTYAVDHLRLEAADLVRLLQHADGYECHCGPVLRAHLPQLRQLRDEAAALVTEAETV